MIVVCDTSPVTNLTQIGYLYLLNKLYGEVLIPEEVYCELREYENHGQLLEENEWIVVRKAVNRQEIETLLDDLDLGECEAIVLAKESNADLLVIDEHRGKSIAKEQGLEIIGLLGVLVKSREEGYIEMLRPILDKLIDEVGFRVSKILYERILKEVDEK